MRRDLYINTPNQIYRILLIGIETWLWPFLAETCSFTIEYNIFITKLCCVTTLTLSRNPLPSVIPYVLIAVFFLGFIPEAWIFPHFLN